MFLLMLSYTDKNINKYITMQYQTRFVSVEHHITCGDIVDSCHVHSWAWCSWQQRTW